MHLQTRESKACQGSLLGSGTGFSYSGNVSVPSYRSSQDDCSKQSQKEGSETPLEISSQTRRIYDLLFHHHDSVVVHTTSVTTTAGVLSHPADSTVSHRHVASHTSSLLQPCYLQNSNEGRWLVCCVLSLRSSLTISLFADRFNNNALAN